MKSTYISTWMQRMAALVLVLVGGISSSLADTKLYLEDFSFSAANETKKVAVCLDTDESTIYSVAMTLTMPTGMQLVADGVNIKTELVGSRTGALTMESAISNGKIMFSDLLRSSAIEAGNGPIFYVFVKDNGFFASANASADINISGVELKRQDKSKVDGVVVTGATVSKNGSEVGGISVAFEASELTMDPGETKTIAVNMDNTGKTVQGFQATLALPTGWTAEVTGPRGAVTYNAETGRITNITGISGVSGAVLNIALTAPTTFAGSAQIKLSDVKATVNYATVNLLDITSTINSTQTVAEKPTVTFNAEEIVVYPGKTGKFEVNMANNGIAVAGFQADLVLPTGWTAAVTGKRGTYTYNANNGRIMNYTGVTGEEGALFEVALTAPANFEGEAIVKLNNVKATINYVGVKLDEISLKVLDKDAAKETALANLKAEITAATTLLGEADITAEPGLSLNNAIAAAQAVLDNAESTTEQINAAVEPLKTAEETYTAAVEAVAKATAKMTLTDEVVAATTLLGDADKTVEPGKALSEAIAAAKVVLASDATTEELTAAIGALKAAEAVYAKAVANVAAGITYSWESPAGEPIEVGGTIAYVNGDGNRLNYQNAGYYTICLNGKKANVKDETASANAGHMVITLDKALQEGDGIVMTAFLNKNGSKKASAYILFENGTDMEGEVYSDEANIDPAFNGVPTTKTMIVPASAAGSKTITMTRSQAGTNLFITKLEIVQKNSLPTGISTVKSNIKNDVIYNLNGQKVNKTSKGLYIINGKKVVIK